MRDMDFYDAIDAIILQHSKTSPCGMVARTAKGVADLWNDPPHGAMQRDIVRDVFEELADALDELLGGGPAS